MIIKKTIPKRATHQQQHQVKNKSTNTCQENTQQQQQHKHNNKQTQTRNKQRTRTLSQIICIQEYNHAEKKPKQKALIIQQHNKHRHTQQTNKT